MQLTMTPILSAILKLVEDHDGITWYQLDRSLAREHDVSTNLMPAINELIATGKLREEMQGGLPSKYHITFGGSTTDTVRLKARILRVTGEDQIRFWIVPIGRLRRTDRLGWYEK